MTLHQSDITMAASDHSEAAAVAAAITTTRRASGHEEDEEEEDLMASPPSLWLPRTVVRRHRKRATVIWASLLAFFFAYVAYIMWDTIDSRRNPPASIAIKQEYYKFPDVAVCAFFLEGCLSQSSYCFEDVAFKMVGQVGFTDVPEDFDADSYPEVDAVRAAYPSCAVMPLSRMTVDEEAVKNGDINSFSASFFGLWLENPDNDFDTEDFPYHTQLVSVFFIDIDADVESIGEEIVDVKIPYERVNFTAGGSFTATQNHMVLSLTEFSGITRNGRQKEREQTFSQSTTAGKQNWVWSSDSASFEAAFLQVEVSISKFEYTSIEEVDPVDGWAIIGAIGGVWQFVVIGFGIFFVFSEKQAPDRKMRNFKKTMAKPAATFNKRLSSTSSRPSQQSGQQDFEIDATDEDLPMEWVKKQTRTGRVYYFNVMTGSRTTRSPNELDGDASGSARARAAVAPPPPPPPPRSTAVHTVFRGAHKSPEYRSTGSASQESAYGSSNGRGSHDDHLPPGWIARTDENGKFYYLDTVSKTTQWKRPTMRVHSTGGVGVQVVDTPMVHTRRTSNYSAAPAAPAVPARIPAPVADIPPTSARRRTATAVHPAADTPSSSVGGPATEKGGVAGEILPPDWEARTAPDGKKYYANNVTKKTQWKAPKV